MKSRTYLAPLCAGLLVTAFAAAFATTTAGKFSGRLAWTIDTAALRVTVLQGGGHVAEIALKTPGAVNPLWVQSRPTIEPSDYNAGRDSARYGGGAGARLMSGLGGHNLCFPYWGNPSPAEEKAGMTYHGETGIATWKQTGAGADWLEVAAELPESRTRFVRRLEVRGRVVWFDETATNEAAWDRPVSWCEHVTMGAPFLERGVTEFAASATLGRPNGSDLRSNVRWPKGTDNGREIDLSVVRDAKLGGEVNNYQIDTSREFGYFAAFNPKNSLVFGYVFRRAEFPWISAWESFTDAIFTRGMEIADTPVHGSGRTLMGTPKLWDVPAYEWLDAKGRLHKRYAAFSTTVPKGFRGVVDVRVEGARLRVLEKGGGPGVSVELGGSF